MDALLPAKDITLHQKIEALTNIIEKDLAAVADDIPRLATKGQLRGLRSTRSTPSCTASSTCGSTPASPTWKKKSSAEAVTSVMMRRRHTSTLQATTPMRAI